MADAPEHHAGSTDDGPAPRAAPTPTTPPPPGTTGSGRLDVSLIGTLPCIVCAYDLQGLSIRSACPECGTLIRATILYRVDPRAEEFTPLYSRRIVAIGLVLWIAGALLIALTGWYRRAGEWLDALTLSRDPRSWLGILAMVGVILSLTGAIAIIRPSSETRAWKSIAALIGVLAYAPMLWAVHRLARLDAITPANLFSTSLMHEREAARLVLTASIIIACLGLRGVARDMAKRSLALRTGRVDRQTLLAIALAAGIGGIGDAMRLWTATGLHSMNQTATLTCNAVGGALVIVASVFVTLGIAGAMGDSLRIARTLWRPGPSMRQLLGDHATPKPTTNPAPGPNNTPNA